MNRTLLSTEFLTNVGVAGALVYLALDVSAPDLVRAAACFGAAIASLGYARARATVKAATKPTT